MEKQLSDYVRHYALIILIHLALVVVWHVFVVVGEVPEYIMPTPADTIASIFQEYNWWHNTLVTSGEIFGGYLLAVVVGVGLALFFSWFRGIEKTFMPLVISLNMVPKVALGPIFIVWFSYGIGPNIIIAFTICFLPILLTTARGMREVDPELIDLVKALNASRWQVFTKIQLPGSLPYIFSGMKVAVVLAVAGAIVGEFIASEEGLGYLMLQVQVTLDTAAMFMAVFLITLIGVSLYGMVLLLERLFVVSDARVETGV
ncbi:MAG: ABC transporter permease [Rhodospirillales bacterium]|nr:ABC transporter permease [Rhodospirillales bacterium]